MTPAPGSDVGRRFPQGEFRITLAPQSAVRRAGADELLFLDGRSRQEPYLCIDSAPTRRVGLAVTGHLVAEESQAPWRLPPEERLVPSLTLEPAAPGQSGERAAHLAEMVPWYAQNALVHYLAPRGLEQFSGGGWGTRDVCQGPVELLLALGRMEPLRDIVLRVMANQNPDGDWPQWFMFFDRERGIRAGDLARRHRLSGRWWCWLSTSSPPAMPLFSKPESRSSTARARTQASARRSGSTSSALSPSSTNGAFPVRHSLPMATATGTILYSPLTLRCVITCAARGRSHCISRP